MDKNGVSLFPNTISHFLGLGGILSFLGLGGILVIDSSRKINELDGTDFGEFEA